MIPYRMTVVLLFIFMNAFGLVLSISSNNWYFTWIGLELNMYAFIPIALLKLSSKAHEMSIKYFITQSIGSGLLLASILTPLTSIPMMDSTVSINSLLMLSALLLKIGLPPLHQWYPNVMSLSPWFLCWMLTVPQKLSPFVILLSMNTNAYLMSSLGGIILIWSSFMINTQSNLRTMMAYSSMGQLSWMILLSQTNWTLSMFMLLNYIFIATMIMFIINVLNWDMSKKPVMNSNKNNTWSILIQWLHLSGIPPFMMFFLKMWGMKTLLSNSLLLPLTMYLIGTLLMLSFYIKTLMTMLMLLKTNTELSLIKLTPTFINSLMLFFSLSILMSYFFITPYLLISY